MPRTCLTNITMPIDGEGVTVSLEVAFEVGRAEPDVGIMGDYIEGFSAKVVSVDAEFTTPELLAVVQAQFDVSEEKWRDEIDEACLESLDDGCE